LRFLLPGAPPGDFFDHPAADSAPRGDVANRVVDVGVGTCGSRDEAVEREQNPLAGIDVRHARAENRDGSVVAGRPGIGVCDEGHLERRPLFGRDHAKMRAADGVARAVNVGSKDHLPDGRNLIDGSFEGGR
jgi:hypothetical protein